MTRANLLTPSRTIAASVMVVMMVGCASLKGSREAIIRVDASRNPTEAARLTLVGVKALEHGEIDRATNRFLDSIAADDTYGPAHNNLGLLHYEQGNLYQAAMAFEKAMDLMPQDATVYYNLALTLESAGRTFEAMDLYHQAVEMDPVNPYYLGNLVRLRLRLGEDDPTLVQQLQDLILIETRPSWRRWADRQLALNLNHSLDRGPAAPDFDSRTEVDPEDDQRLQNNIIELSPPPRGSRSDLPSGSRSSLPSGSRFGLPRTGANRQAAPNSLGATSPGERSGDASSGPVSESTIESLPVPLVGPGTTRSAADSDDAGSAGSRRPRIGVEADAPSIKVDDFP
jgi:tetratricopeptide (TPR) repeat protein